MKKSTRLLAVLLTFLMLFSAIPLTAGAEDTPARTVSFESAQVGDVLTLTYSLTSELPVLNAQMTITYPESVTLTSTFETDEAKQEAFPVINKEVVVHHDAEKRTVEFAVTNASGPYTFTEESVLCSLKFTVATAGKVDILYDIEYIGAENNDDQTPAGQAIVEKNEVKDDKATEKMEVTRESSGMDKAVINGKDAQVNQYVYYEYSVTTDMALEDGEIKITYPSEILQLVDQDNALRFPTLQGYPSLKLETKADTAGVFTVNFTDVDENDVIDGFDNGKVLVLLAFKVTNNGTGDIKAETIALDGRNPDGVVEDGIPIDPAKNVKEEVTVTNELRKVFNVTFPTVEGLTFTGASIVLEDQDYTFTITADEGYDISKMVVKNGNDTLTGKDGVYTIQAVKANVNITVTGVTKKSLKVTLPTGTGFTVKGEETVEYGENYTFTIEIEEGYTDKDMTVTATVDGKDVEVNKGADGKYTIENVTGDIVIKVEGVKEDSDTPTPPTPTGLLGDVDMSKDIGTNDVTLILQYIAGIVHEGDEGYDHSVSDVTGDGATDTLDATAILQYIAEIITKFPADK